ncbi:Cytochrome P450 [Amanita muscaria]
MIDLSSFSSAVVLLSVLCFLSYSLSLYTKRPHAPYPPGPTPKPIIGNAMDMQSDVRPWLHYLEWSKRLRSGIVHISAFNTRLVVLHKMEDAIALLEKRSSIYSDRPILPIIELLGMDFSTGILPHQDRWRRHRRVFQEAFRKDRIASYHHIITEKVHLFLGELLKDPSNFSNHCKWLAASLTFGVTFGYEVAPGQIHDRFIEVADLATKTTTELMVPGRTILNVLPFLGRIPSWVPGASTQRLCARVKEALGQYKTPRAL